jgi:hypothetical protein
MLEAARMTGSMQRFINVSTDEVYRETSLGKERGEQRLIIKGFGFAAHSQLVWWGTWESRRVGVLVLRGAHDGQHAALYQRGNARGLRRDQPGQGAR